MDGSATGGQTDGGTGSRSASEPLVQIYLRRIQELDRTGPMLRAVQEINPDALAIARTLDAERSGRGPR